MAAKKKARQGRQRRPWQARYNPYVQRRRSRTRSCAQNIVQAYESAATPTARLSNGKSPTKQIFDDKKLQKDLKNAAESLPRRVASRCARRPRSRRAAAASAASCCSASSAPASRSPLSEGLRKKVLDALFGAEEEFEYTSTTSSPTSASRRRPPAPPPRRPAARGCPRGSRPPRRPRSPRRSSASSQRLLSG